MTETRVLRAAALTKSYGRRVVVREVGLEIRQGEVVGLLGPNGAGKTTTFYMVVGLTRPDSGQVYLGEEDITELPMYQRARAGIGYLPQEASVFRKLSAEENVLAILETRGLPGSEQRALARQLLEELGIAGMARQPAYTLSGGERRRLEICRALAASPRFILLDEPFAGIDPLAVLDIQKIIAHLKDRGIGILITDHNVRETLQHHRPRLHPARRQRLQLGNATRAGLGPRGPPRLPRRGIPPGRAAGLSGAGGAPGAPAGAPVKTLKMADPAYILRSTMALLLPAPPGRPRGAGPVAPDCGEGPDSAAGRPEAPGS